MLGGVPATCYLTYVGSPHHHVNRPLKDGFYVSDYRKCLAGEYCPSSAPTRFSRNFSGRPWITMTSTRLASSGFSENKGLGGVLSLAGSKNLVSVII